MNKNKREDLIGTREMSRRIDTACVNNVNFSDRDRRIARNRFPAENISRLHTFCMFKKKKNYNDICDRIYIFVLL